MSHQAPGRQAGIYEDYADTEYRPEYDPDADPADAFFRATGQDLAELPGNKVRMNCPVHGGGGKELEALLTTDGKVIVKPWCGCVFKDFTEWACKEHGISRSVWDNCSRHKGVAAEADAGLADMPPDPAGWARLAAATTDQDLQVLTRAKKGITLESLRALGVVRDGREYRIPYTVNGQIRDYRRVWRENGKWVVWTRKREEGGKSRVFAPFELDPSKPVWLCAGEWDALAMWAQGYQVAWTGGGESWPLPATELARFEGFTVIVGWDADETGRQQSPKRAAELRKAGATVKELDWPKNWGPKGRNDLRDWINLAGEPPEALISAAAAGFSFEFLGAQAFDDLAEPLPPTVFDPGSGALFYDDSYNAIFGESGSGKSWVALAAVADVLKRGGTALYLDYESSRNQVLNRLRELGVTNQDVDGRLAYVEAANITAAQMSEAVRAISVPFGISIIDGVTSSLSQCGKSDREAVDVTAWYQWLPRRLKGCVVSVDHVPKPSSEKFGTPGPLLYPISSQAKRAVVTGVMYGVVQEKPLGRNVTGQVRLVLAKDKDGYLEGQMGADRTAARLKFISGEVYDGYEMTVVPGTVMTEEEKSAREREAVEKAAAYLAEKAWTVSVNPAWELYKADPNAPKISRDGVFRPAFSLYKARQVQARE